MSLKNFFFKTPVLLIFIFLLGVFSVLWHNYSISRAIDSIARAEILTLERDMAHGVSIRPSLIDDLINKGKVLFTKHCSHRPCIEFPKEKKYVQISPGYAEGLAMLAENRYDTLWFETAVIIFIMLIGLGYMVWMLIRERKINREREQFIAMATHELKHPISSVSLLLQSIYRGTLKGKSKNEYLERALSEIRGLNIQLENLMHIHDLKHFSSLENTKYNLVDMVLSIIEGIGKGSPDASNRIIFFNETHKNEIPMQHNQEGMRLILINLIDNALKYSDEKIEVCILKNRKKTILEVRDFGAGFSEKDKERAYDMFYRSSRHTVQNIKGSGLGLFTTNRLVQLMNLKMDLNSEGEDKGSCLRVYL